MRADVAPAPESAARRAVSWRRGAGVTLLYAVLTFALSYPLALHPASRVLGPGTDPDLWMWTLAWDVHAFTHQPWAIFDANIFYPAHYALAYSENLIGSALLAAPIIWTTHNPVLAMNLVVLGSTVLCACGAYLLGRRLGLEPPAAIATGLIFGFAPARFLRIEQVHLATIQWVPFGLAFLHRYWDERRPADLRLFAACFSLQALTSGHGAAFLTVASAALIAYRLACGDRPALSGRLRDLGWSGALLLLPVGLLLFAYHAAHAEVPALHRKLDDFGVSLSSYFASGSHVDTAIFSRLPHWMTDTAPDAYLFPGYLPLLLALVPLLAWPRRGAAAAATRPGRMWRHAGTALELLIALFVAAGLFAWRSPDPVLRIGGIDMFTARRAWRPWAVVVGLVAARVALTRQAPLRLRARLEGSAAGWTRWWRIHGRHATVFYAGLTLLSVWLTLGPPLGLWRWVYWLPVFDFLRVPSRFVLLEILGLAVLAGFGLERILNKVRASRRSALAAVVGALLVAEFVAAPLAPQPDRIEIPPIDQWLNSLPKPFVIAEVPVTDSRSDVTNARRNTLYMLYSMAHWQKTVHGYSGVEPAGYKRLYWQLTTFPDPASLRSLTDLGVTYIVMHPGLYPPSELGDAEARFVRYQDWLTLVHTEADGRVYRLHRPVSPPRP
jgi:hypothetical protein